jgi:hypothetical protein
MQLLLLYLKDLATVTKDYIMGQAIKLENIKN